MVHVFCLTESRFAREPVSFQGRTTIKLDHHNTSFVCPAYRPRTYPPRPAANRSCCESTPCWDMVHVFILEYIFYMGTAHRNLTLSTDRMREYTLPPTYF